MTRCDEPHQPLRKSWNMSTFLDLIRYLGISPGDWDNWIFRWIQKRPGCRVLDLGSDGGWLWKSNLRQIPPDWMIVLADTSTDKLEEACRHLGHCNRHFAFQVLDLHHFPFEDASFDLVLAPFALALASEGSRLFQETQRVLRANGFFYVATLSEKSFASLNRFLEMAGLPPWVPVPTFSLEQGAEYLANWFPSVTLHQLTIPLVIREAESVFRCLCFGMAADLTHHISFQHLEEHLQQELFQQREILLPLQIGLFEATNGVETASPGEPHRFLTKML